MYKYFTVTLKNGKTVESVVEVSVDGEYLMDVNIEKPKYSNDDELLSQDEINESVDLLEQEAYNYDW